MEQDESCIDEGVGREQGCSVTVCCEGAVCNLGVGFGENREGDVDGLLVGTQPEDGAEDDEGRGILVG